MFIETRKDYLFNLNSAESVGIIKNNDERSHIFARVNGEPSERVIYIGNDCETVLSDIMAAMNNNVNVYSLEKFIKDTF